MLIFSVKFAEIPEINQSKLVNFGHKLQKRCRILKMKLQKCFDKI